MKKYLKSILYPVLGFFCVIGITLAVPFFILLEADEIEKKDGSDCNPNGPDPETKGN